MRFTAPPAARQATTPTALSRGVTSLVRWARASLVRRRRIAQPLLLKLCLVPRVRARDREWEVLEVGEDGAGDGAGDDFGAGVEAESGARAQGSDRGRGRPR